METSSDPTATAAPRCTYYQGCTEPAKSCGYCTTHCLCGAGERFDQLLADGGFGDAKHDAPFGHCAKCRRGLPVSTGADGAVIVSMGHCPDWCGKGKLPDSRDVCMFCRLEDAR